MKEVFQYLYPRLFVEPMNELRVQWIFPVDNPVDNVRSKTAKGVVTIEIPINFPDVHLMSVSELLNIAAQARLRELSTRHNNTDSSKKDSKSV